MTTETIVWQSVDENMPHDDTVVVAFAGELIFTAWHSGENWLDCVTGDTCRVTHWAYVCGPDWSNYQ